ncbi:hypothetical protein J6590_008006 [Homalodisca vitripennis]|nr:hypothetical protein J6590_008006 [Homalodisca vitripennis]
MHRVLHDTLDFKASMPITPTYIAAYISHSQFQGSHADGSQYIIPNNTINDERQRSLLLTLRPTFHTLNFKARMPMALNTSSLTIQLMMNVKNHPPLTLRLTRHTLNFKARITPTYIAAYISHSQFQGSHADGSQYIIPNNTINDERQRSPLLTLRPTFHTLNFKARMPMALNTSSLTIQLMMNITPTYIAAYISHSQFQGSHADGSQYIIPNNTINDERQRSPLLTLRPTFHTLNFKARMPMALNTSSLTIQLMMNGSHADGSQYIIPNNTINDERQRSPPLTLRLTRHTLNFKARMPMALNTSSPTMQLKMNVKDYPA